MKTLLLTFTLLSLNSWGDVAHRTEGFLTSRYRSFEDSPYAERNQDNFLYIRHEVTWTKDNLRFVASPFAVLFNSQLEKQGADAILTNSRNIFVDKRGLDIEQRLDEDDYNFGLTDFQEFYLGWSKDSYSLDIGRRVIALGNLKLLPGWNKFNPTAVSLRPTWLNGVDHVKATWQGEQTKVMAYGIADQTLTDRAQFIVVEHFISPVQVSVLGGKWWEANAAGLSMTVDVAGWLLKFEGLNLGYYGRRETLEAETQIGAGVERSFAQDWNVNVEFLTQSEGAQKESDYIGFSLSPHQAFRAESYAAGELRWTPNPFMTYTALALHNLIDQSSLLGLIVARQWEENYELSLGVMSGQGEGELGAKAKLLSATTLLGIPSQVDLTLKAFF